MADLSGVLAGIDPTMPLELQAGLAASLADPSRMQTGGDPAAAQFANLSAQFQGTRAADIAQKLATQRTAALPDLAAALQADDPWKYVAANPNMNPVAAAHILSSTPAQVAAARDAMARAALARAQVPGLEAIGQAQVERVRGALGGGGAAAPGAPGAPVAGAPGAPGPDAVSAAPYQFPARPEGAAAPAAAAPAVAEADPLATMPANPADRPAWYKGLSPTQQFAVKIRSKQLATQQMRPGAQVAPGPAAIVQPPVVPPAMP